MDCYRFESVNGSDPLFHNVDATYVIHLENNGRLDKIKTELRQHYPSQNTSILYNKGYKKCEKQLPEKETRFDLMHANLHIFEDARKKQYKNILILEDDFFFRDNIRDYNGEVDEFLKTHESTEFVYYLGNMPLVMFPYSGNHFRSIVGMGSHGVIYSESYRNELSKIPMDVINDWDVYQMGFRNHRRFMYGKPLCYQLFPETENSQKWGEGNIILRFLGWLVFRLFQLLRLNVQTDPGYPLFYFLGKYLVLIIVIIIVFNIIGIAKLKSFYKTIKTQLRKRK